MSSLSIIFLTATLFSMLAIGVCFLFHIEQNPFRYPYFITRFDVSGKRNVDVEDLIDAYLCDANNWAAIKGHQEKIESWKQNAEKSIKEGGFKEKRLEQFQSVIDDENAFRFRAFRKTSQYPDIAVSFAWLEERHEKLAKIGFETTLRKFHSKNQRRLMNKDLRNRIKERDAYTCQMCGKYMPDEVGLQIDHIIPVSKGGKSVESNLRVLCSKCNGRKGAKYDTEHSSRIPPEPIK